MIKDTLLNHAALGEWSTVAIISAHPVVLTALYPWSKLKSAS
jgi:hypothetical protein